jgi:pilus assembly protein CpaC
MPMHLTCLKRSACRISAFIVLLSGAMPVAALAAPDSVTKKELSAPVAKKAMPVAAAASTEPIAKKALPKAGAKKKSHRLFAKKVLPKPVRRKYSPVPFMSAMNTPSIYRVPLGESKVYRFAQPISRIAVGDPDVADYIMLNRFEIYLLGKKLGSTNLTVWNQQGNLTSRPLQVSRSTVSLQSLLTILFPKEHDIHILSMGQALVLSGSVSDPLVAEGVSRVASASLGTQVSNANTESALTDSGAHSGSGALGGILASSGASSTSGGGSAAGSTATQNISGVVNLLTVRNSQQVRLEVRIAQVSKTYLESLGFNIKRLSGDLTGGLSTGLVSNATLNLLLQPDYQIRMAAQRKPTLFKMLAEPTIVTMSGKEGYFLVGGKVYTPTLSTSGAIDYEERTYGVGLRFTPIVLDAGRVSLKVAAEDSEPSKTPITDGRGNTLPSFSMNIVSTTVQMKEGENLVIGGLTLDNLTNSIDSVPLLGQIPILGALFRSTDKNAEKTELMVIVRPTLVKASATAPELPTDKVVPPTRGELFLGGKLEGSQKK